MDFILAPDVLVNASVAPGSSPDKVVQRTLGRGGAKPKTSAWVIDCIEALLSAHPNYKKEAIKPQVDLIRGFFEVVALPSAPGVNDWEAGLVATAKAAGAKLVVTDHPDLVAKERSQGVEFNSTDAWLLEQAMPPPPPPPKK